MSEVKILASSSTPKTFFTQHESGLSTNTSCLYWRSQSLLRTYYLAAVCKVRYNNRKIVVTTRCGDNYIADYGLVTFSHGVLSSDAVTFQPSLPDWKLESIYKMPMAVYTKIFIKFPYKFWDDSTWILYAHKNRGYFPVWMNVEVKSTSIVCWCRKVGV